MVSILHSINKFIIQINIPNHPSCSAMAHTMHAHHPAAIPHTSENGM
jgi:hypothetical protein